MNFRSFSDELVKLSKAGSPAQETKASSKVSKALERYAAENPKAFAKLMAKLKESKKGKGVYRGVVRQMTTPAHGEPDLEGKALKALVSAIKS